MENLIEQIKHIPAVERFTSPVNPYWIKIRNASITIVAIAGAIVLLPNAGIEVSEHIMNICNKILIAGVAVGITAQNTKK
jgi:hypothetical protein